MCGLKFLGPSISYLPDKAKGIVERKTGLVFISDTLFPADEENLTLIMVIFLNYFQVDFWEMKNYTLFTTVLAAEMQTEDPPNCLYWFWAILNVMFYYPLCTLPINSV